MGWRAIEIINKMAELERQAAKENGPAPEPAVKEPVNALRELPEQSKWEVLTGPEGWVVGVPEGTVLEFENGEVMKSEPIETVVVEKPVEEVEKKPKAKKPKKVPEPTT